MWPLAYGRADVTRICLVMRRAFRGRLYACPCTDPAGRRCCSSVECTGHRVNGTRAGGWKFPEKRGGREVFLPQTPQTSCDPAGSIEFTGLTRKRLLGLPGRLVSRLDFRVLTEYTHEFFARPRQMAFGSSGRPWLAGFLPRFCDTRGFQSNNRMCTAGGKAGKKWSIAISCGNTTLTKRNWMR